MLAVQRLNIPGKRAHAADRSRLRTQIAFSRRLLHPVPDGSVNSGDLEGGIKERKDICLMLHSVQKLHHHLSRDEVVVGKSGTVRHTVFRCINSHRTEKLVDHKDASFRTSRNVVRHGVEGFEKHFGGEIIAHLVHVDDGRVDTMKMHGDLAVARRNLSQDGSFGHRDAVSLQRLSEESGRIELWFPDAQFLFDRFGTRQHFPFDKNGV